MIKIIFKIAVGLLAVALVAMAGFFLFQERNQEYIKQEVEKITKKPYVQIMFAGDLMFDRGIRYYADKNGSNDFIFTQIKDLLSQNDLNVVNLEGPITDNASVSIDSKVGSTDNYYFTFDPSVAKTLYDNNIKLVNLGNNHIDNFKQDGIRSTENYLTYAGVDYFGSPYRSKSIVKDVGGLKIAFVNYNQFLPDLPKEWGDTINEIKKVKKESDIVIVFCHWGIEYASEATKEQIDLGHKFIDAGADLVVGSHPHVIEQVEEYKGKRIYYSLGNFIFDQYFSEDVRTGLALQVKINRQSKGLEFIETKTYLQAGGQTILLKK